MSENMALLILSWQVACLFHETETEKLLPGSTSATEAESDNASFGSAKDRTAACVEVLKQSTAEFQSKVLESMLRVAAASREDDNESNVSPEEMDFIQQVRSALE